MLNMICKKLGIDSHSSAISTISPLEASQKVSNGDLLLIDVRELNEWAASGTPKGSECISLSNKDFISEVLQLTNNKKDIPIAVCCKSGMRGEKAVNMLLTAKFENVANIDGGMMRWLSDKLPLA